MNTSSLIARNAARSTRTIARRRANITPVRKYASDPMKNPAPLDSTSTKTSKKPETKGAGQPLLIGGFIAGVAIGYYYYTRRTDESKKDVNLKARELNHAAHVQMQEGIDEGRDKFDQAKADGHAKIDSTQASIQSTYNEAANKASSAAAEAQARLASYKDAAAAQLQRSKEASDKATHDAKAYTEEKAQQAQSSWWSWLGWGKARGEDAKEAAAAEAAQAAREVKETAAETEKGAQKRA